PSSRNTFASQKTNEPDAQRLVRLSAFQIGMKTRVQPAARSILTVAPPPRARPPSMTPARSANNSWLGYESASMNTSQSPEAAEAPLFRAREIWLTGSNTTDAPAARAFSAVRSVELLSQTMTSL